MRSVVKYANGDRTPEGLDIRDTYNPYSDAKRPLVENLGGYCSYCERPLPGSELDVEHVLHKDLHGDQEFAWVNFLLSCSNCNRAKWDKPVDLHYHYFPHLVNTYTVFKGCLGLNTEPRDNLQPHEIVAANDTLKLLHLERNPFSAERSTPADDRYKYRNLASSKVTRYLSKYTHGELTLEILIDYAVAIGYWSIWMDAFAAYPAVQDALIAAFPGTYPDCRNGQIARP
jgi:HNH endonuclease